MELHPILLLQFVTCTAVFQIQGDPNRNFLFQMALFLKWYIFEPRLVKPKWVWEVAVFCVKSKFFEKLQKNYKFLQNKESFRPRVIWNKKFRFGSPCNCRKVLIKWLYFDPCRYVLKILVQRNRLDLVEDLLDNGADVTQHGGWKRWERNAVMNNQTFCLAFVEHFDVFLKLFHRTGLHVALHFDYLDIAKILVDSDTSKISLNTQDNDGR